MLSLATNVLAFNGPALPIVHSAAARSPAANMVVYSWSQPGEGAIWDPLRLASTPERFERLRYVEVKHGRIAMLAVLGHITAAAGARWPGVNSAGESFSSIPGSGFEALSKCSVADLAVIFLTVGFLEVNVMKERVKGEFPGDLRNGLFKDGWDNFSDAEKKSKINKELNNGRAAMMGITGLMMHEQLGVDPYIGTGVDWRVADIISVWNSAGA